MKKSMVAAFVLVLFVVLGCFVLVQADPPVKDTLKEKEFSELRQKIKALKKKKIVEALALTKEAADAVLSVIDKHDAQMHDLIRSMKDDIHNLKKAVNDKKDDTVKQAIIDKITKTRTELIAVKQAEIDELKGILTVDQQAKYILFSIDFHKTISKIMAEKRGKYDNGSKGD
ncbi:MAG: hypothetical protein HQK97_04665 [Nitrospirae bacterium]|nr:hypothetical protein [Nitrospirota bacterium]